MVLNMAVYINSIQVCSSYSLEGHNVLMFANVSVFASHESDKIVHRTAHTAIRKNPTVTQERINVGLLFEDTVTVSAVINAIRIELMDLQGDDLNRHMKRVISEAEVVPFEGMADSLTRMLTDLERLTESK